MPVRYEADDYSEWGVIQYHGTRYNPAEQDEIISTFSQMLRAVTKDGGNKRAAGTKVNWKVDTDHERGLFSHLAKWKAGEYVDRDSGAHPLVHAAWRALALAYQECEAGKQSDYITAQLSEQHDPALD